MLDFQKWLENPNAIRSIFVELVVSAYNTTLLIWEDKTIYLSNTGYLTNDNLTNFLPIIIGGAKITENLSIDGSLSISFGDIEIYNSNGEYDTWLDSSKFVWVNKPIEIYYGDPLVSSTSIGVAYSTNFEKIFSGVIADIDSKSRNTLNIKIRDKLERLNTPLTESKLGTYGVWAGGQKNQDAINPIVFGEVHNITPLLIDPSTLEYKFNDGDSERLIEVRDNGIPITIGSTNISAGTFKLAYPSNGSITASVQGTTKSINLSTGILTTSYVNTVAKLLALIVMQYGTAANRLTVDDIDFINLNAFDTLHSQSIGMAILDRENTLSVCASLAASIGAQIYFNRLGKLQLLKLGTYSTDAIVNITDADILFHSLEISNKTTVIAATKIGYCKNWTVQPGIVTNIPMSHKTMFAEEWFSETVVDSLVKTQYKLNNDPVQKDTFLLTSIDASNEAARLNNYFKQPRTCYKMIGTSKLLSLKLGQEVLLTHNRFGLSNGKSAQVISLSPDWLNSTIEIEVIV